jgi:hypothetical protein
MNEWLKNQVRDRAGSRCEYCQIHQDQEPFYTFPVDHIIAQQHRGSTVLDNLCLSCFRCNSHKGPNIASIDPATSEMSPLYHPRHDVWNEHFEWHGAELVGLTPIGRATVEVLAVNHPDHVLLREALISEASFPPTGKN